MSELTEITGTGCQSGSQPKSAACESNERHTRFLDEIRSRVHGGGSNFDDTDLAIMDPRGPDASTPVSSWCTLTGIAREGWKLASTHLPNAASAAYRATANLAHSATRAISDFADTIVEHEPSLDTAATVISVSGAALLSTLAAGSALLAYQSSWGSAKSCALGAGAAATLGFAGLLRWARSLDVPDESDACGRYGAEGDPGQRREGDLRAGDGVSNLSAT